MKIVWNHENVFYISLNFLVYFQSFVSPNPSTPANKNFLFVETSDWHIWAINQTSRKTDRKRWIMQRLKLRECGHGISSDSKMMNWSVCIRDTPWNCNGFLCLVWSRWLWCWVVLWPLWAWASHKHQHYMWVY